METHNLIPSLRTTSTKRQPEQNPSGVKETYMFRCHHGQDLARGLGSGQGPHAPLGWTGISLGRRTRGLELFSRGQAAPGFISPWRLTKRSAALATVLFIALLLPGRVAAQSAPADQPAPQEQPASSGQAASSVSPPSSTGSKAAGWTAFEQIQASRTCLGTVMTEDTDLGYAISDHASADVGLPFIVTRSPFSVVATRDYYWSPAWRSPYLDLKYNTVYQGRKYTTVLTVNIPLANEDRIFTTGRFGVDWFNHIEEDKGNVTPFLNFGVSNGAADRFIMPRPYTVARPYQTLGFLGDVEPGAEYSRKRGLGKGFGLGASYYALVPAGPQKVFSRLVLPYSAISGDGQHNRYFDTNFETTLPGETPIDQALLLTSSTGYFDGCENVSGVLTCKGGLASIARDNGYSGWLHVTRWRGIDVQLGYTRSIHYRLDVYTLAITYDGTSLVRRLLIPL